MFKYGIKIWSVNKDWFSEVVELIKQGKADFVEIYLVPSSFKLSDFDIFKQNNIQVSLHCPHTSHNFDVFNLTKKSLDIWNNQVVKTADYLNSQFIILHPGIGENKETFKRESLKIKDSRVLMESMVKVGFVGVEEGGVMCFGYSKEELEFIHKDCGFDICFDVCHSLASAAWQKIDSYDFISECIDLLKPRYFHLAGGNIEDETDRHLDLWEGNFDYKFIKEKLAKAQQAEDIYLSFEVPKKGDGLENDLKNIEYFKNL
ncbi:MAG: TIM barrel protein [Candidatus Pacebacteria bacterium]|nr:TIM barrel protein [Candidatus Paceibacterota bacterium]